MKTILIYSLGIIAALSLNSCQRKGCTDYSACNFDSKATRDDGTCNYGCGGNNGGGNNGGGNNSVGQITFWNNDSWIGNISVSFGGTTKVINANVNPSNCNTSGCANFTIAPGTYPYTASATTGEYWSGSHTVTSNGCLKVNLID